MTHHLPSLSTPLRATALCLAALVNLAAAAAIESLAAGDDAHRHLFAERLGVRTCSAAPAHAHPEANLTRTARWIR